MYNLRIPSSSKIKGQYFSPKKKKDSIISNADYFMYHFNNIKFVGYKICI